MRLGTIQNHLLVLEVSTANLGLDCESYTAHHSGHGLEPGDRILEVESEGNALSAGNAAAMRAHIEDLKHHARDDEDITIVIGFHVPELLRGAEEWNNRLLTYRTLRHPNKANHRWGLPVECGEAISNFLIRTLDDFT